MLTFGDLIRRNGVYWSSRDAFIDSRIRLTWGEYHLRTDALAHALRRLGIRQGERVAVISPDCVEVAETFGACMKAGAIRVGLNARLAGAEIAALAADCGPRVIFVHADSVALADAATSDAGVRDAHVVVFGGAGSEYERLVAEGLREGSFAQTPHDVAMIAYTTGSTGLPKGAIYPHEPMLRSILYIALSEGIDADSRWLHAMPAAGIPLMHMLRNIFHAAATVIVGHWNAEHALSLIERERTTNTVLVPTMLNSLLESDQIGRTDVSSMRLIGYGASSLPPATIRDAMDVFKRPFLQMFGSTELMGMSMMLLPQDHARGVTTNPEILASAGKPLPYVEVRIIDDEGRDQPAGEVGELIVRSEVAFSGYWNAPDKDRETLRDGWLYTGDMARLDGEGYVYLSDRAKFRIKSGGYNIFPTEIENVLAEHPAVNEVAVFGLPDPRWGDRIQAVVSLLAGQSATEEDLREFCRGRIAGFKIPKQIDIWHELPKGVTGKIQKRDIIARFESSAGSEA